MTGVQTCALPISLNNGYWLVSAVPANGVAPFNTTLYPTGYTNPAPGFSLMRRASATSAWGLEGTCMYPGPITAIQRTGMTTMGTSTGYAIAQALSPLPVELLTLNAFPNGKSIQVEWSTASELNNAGFEVLRSLTGSDWHSIGWVAGHGTTSNFNSYK